MQAYTAHKPPDNPPGALFDPDAVREHLTRLHEGRPFEVRAVRRRKNSVYTGYFDDVEAAVRAVTGKLRGDAKGWYTTLNPITPELLGRAYNRLEDFPAATTADHDATGYRHLLVDVDPVRPAETSSTDEQLAAALGVRDAIADYLADVLDAAPLYWSMSGNGGSLVYRLALLPNDQDTTALIKGCLEALGGAFGTATVKVDQSVFNAARITKLIGTPVRKGDDTPRQPHRVAVAEYCVEEAPGEVTPEQLRALAATHTPPAPVRTPQRGTGSGVGGGRTWTVEEVLTRSGVGYTTKTTTYGTVYRLDRCLTSDAHEDGATITEAPGGTLYYRCLHDTCTGKRWADAKAALDLPERPPRPGAAPGGPPDDDAPHPADTAGAAGPPGTGVSTSNTLYVPALWPAPPGAEAYGGLAGDVVRLAHGCTEADPVAVLATFLVKFSAMLGRGPYTTVGAQRHRMVEYALLVGETAKARKGSSEAPVDAVLGRVDGWPRGNTKGGLSTGEGIIHDLRDATENDPGPEDRRRLYVETEFVRVLRASQRQGNTLSPVLRQLWDGDPLSTLTKAAPEVASEGHGAVLAHTTANELRREGGDAELHNGLLNRFLCPVVRRSGVLSCPDAPDEATATGIAQRLQARLSDVFKAGGRGPRLVFSDGARRLWRRVYREMTRELGGTVGAAVARLDAHCLRLAALYALADTTAPITGDGEGYVLAVWPRHLEAAASLCRYLRRSARYLYGDKTGDARLDQILEYLGRQPGGAATATDLYVELFQKNVKANVIAEALALGVKLGRLAQSKGVAGGAGGRPPTAYVLTHNVFDVETPTDAERQAEAAEEKRGAQAERDDDDYINAYMWRPAREAAALWAAPPDDGLPAAGEPAAASAPQEAPVWPGAPYPSAAAAVNGHARALPDEQDGYVAAPAPAAAPAEGAGEAGEWLL